VHIRLGWGKLRERDHFEYLEYLGIDARIILEWIVKIHRTAWTGMIWLGIGLNGRLF
jgi:hypothetical protein